MKRACLLLLLSITQLACATLPIQRQTFLAVETPHFLVVSSLGWEETLELGAELELFRVGLEFAAGRKLQPSNVKPVLLAFDGRGLVRDFMLYGAKGYFLPTPQRPFLVLRAGAGFEEDATIAQRSALARYLLREGGIRQPLWLETGISHFASTIEARGQGARVGVPRYDHVDELRDRTAQSLADTLFATDLSTRVEIGRRIFASQSWGLVHYFRVGQRGAQGTLNPLDRYARELAAGTEDIRAAEVAFRATPEELADAVNAYVRRDSMPRMVIRHGEAGAPRPERVEMQRSDVLSLLADLALALGRPDVADRFYGYALKVDEKSGRAAAGLAVTAAMEGAELEADQRLASALALGGAEARVQLGVGKAYYELARSGRSDLRERNLRGAREHLLRSRDMDPDDPETHAMLGALQTLPGENASAGLAHLRRARGLMPASLELELLTAELMALAGDRKGAATWLRDVVSRSETRATRERALESLESLEGPRTH